MCVQNENVFHFPCKLLFKQWFKKYKYILQFTICYFQKEDCFICNFHIYLSNIHSLHSLISSNLDFRDQFVVCLTTCILNFQRKLKKNKYIFNIQFKQWNVLYCHLFLFHILFTIQTNHENITQIISLKKITCTSKIVICSLGK